MMYSEFQELAGYEVEYKTYKEVIEPMYNAVTLNKQDFIKTLNRAALEKKKEKEKIIKKMLVRNRMCERKTPNGCYYYIQYVELVRVDLATGKLIIKPLEEEDLRKIQRAGNDLNYSYDYDFDYLMCADMKKKPIELDFGY